MSTENRFPSSISPDGLLSGLITGGPRLGSSQHATKLARSLHSGRAAELLREAIVDGTLPTGTPLVENRLAEHFNMSRGPIRSALTVLEGEGLAQTLPNGRMVVAGLSQDDVEDLLRVRYELETRAIRWGMERKASLDLVEDAMSAILAERSTSDRLVELDISFHRAIVETANSRFLLRSWMALAPVIQSVITIGNRRLGMADPETHLARIVESHTTLMDALRGGDPDVAAAQLAAQFGLTGSMFTEGLAASTDQE